MNVPALPPRSVLAAYADAVAPLRWVPVPGGFSGAAVWRGDDLSGNPIVALKQWPAETTPERLAFIHAAVARADHLPFVSRVIPTTAGESFVESGGRLWDATSWLPGSPCDAPSVWQVESAGAAVARLHSAWPVIRVGPCPGALNRLRVLGDWMRTPPAPPDRGFPVPLLATLQRSWELATRHASQAASSLQVWETERLPLRLCVRDLRSEHVLFTGDEVTGVVDYGAVAEDHAAVDLARMLGDLAADDEELFVASLRGYAASGAVPELDPGLVRVLARTGLLCSVIGWLIRLLVERRTFADVAAVSTRLSQLVHRVELFPSL